MYGPFCVYNDEGSAIPMYSQANPNSRVYIMIPSEEEIKKLNWANDEWIYCSYTTYVRNKRNRQSSEQTFRGYVPRKNVYYCSHQKIYDLPEKNNDIDGWERFMNDYFEVRGNDSVPIMQNMRPAGEAHGKTTYMYDTIGWLAPKTAVQHIAKKWRNPDKKYTIYTQSINAPDSIRGFMYGYHLTPKNQGILKPILWRLKFANPSRHSKVLAWKNELFYQWSKRCAARMNDTTQSFWYRYGWFLLGGILWLIGSFLWYRFSYIVAIIWDVAIPWLYFSIVNDSLWFANPFLVGWWSAIGLPVFLLFAYMLIRRIVGNYFMIWPALGEGKWLYALYHIAYTVGTAIVAYDVLVSSDDQGVLIFVILILLLAASRGASSGAQDSHKAGNSSSSGNSTKASDEFRTCRYCRHCPHGHCEIHDRDVSLDDTCWDFDLGIS